MTEETLKQASTLKSEIAELKEILNECAVYIWGGNRGCGYYTTTEITQKLRKILQEELQKKEEEFANL